MLRKPAWEPLLAQLILSAASLPSHLSLTPALFFFPQDHIPVPYQPDSSSNPSSTTSSTPSSPAPPLPPSATPPSPLHPSPQCPRQKKNFNLPGTSVLRRQVDTFGREEMGVGFGGFAKASQDRGQPLPESNGLIIREGLGDLQMCVQQTRDNCHTMPHFIFWGNVK